MPATFVELPPGPGAPAERLEGRRLRHPQGELTLLEQGAQLLAWQPAAAGAPVLFLAGNAQGTRGKPVRGGTPICWPWFGPHADPALPSHGFARNQRWALRESCPLADGRCRVVGELVDSPASRALWPHPFHLSCELTLGETLQIRLRTTNTGPAPFTYSEALHTYFQVSAIDRIEVHGLDGVAYLDSLASGARRVQEGPVRFEGEVDRIYQGPPSDLSIEDPGHRRRIRIRTQGSRSTVVWNPGAGKAARLADLGPAQAGVVGWQEMVCVESGNVGEHAITLAPGEQHELAVEYAVGLSG